MSACLLASPARAETLAEALAAAYASNARIRSAEAQVKAASEAASQAVAARLPSVTALVDAGLTGDNTTDDNPFGAPGASMKHYRLFEWQATLTQVLYRGGSISAKIDQTQALAEAQGAALTTTVQSVLLSTATAYLDLLQARENVGVTQHNLEALSTQRDSVELELARQGATTVDFNQAVSRYEDAVAQNRQALGALTDARTTYRRWIGHDPVAVAPPLPPADLPDSRDEAIAQAADSSPAVVQAVFTQRAAESDIDIAVAQVLPSVSMVAHYNRELDTMGLRRGGQTDYGVVMQVSLPLYQGGAPAAQLSSAREIDRQRRLQIEQARDQARLAAAKAWDARVSAGADLASRKIQTKAAKVALEGLLRERLSGSRTVLDTLNGRQDLLKALLAEAKARHDFALAGYRLLAAIGHLTPDGLHLGVDTFDSRGEIDRAGSRWYDPAALVP